MVRDADPRGGSRRCGTLVVTREVPAQVEEAWAAMTDWDRQSEWMLGTRVRGTIRGGHGVGGGIEAFTGIGRFGFLDTMVVTVWEPPHRCVVRHTGRVVRGTGVFEAAPTAGGRSLVTWGEDLVLPFGRLGLLGWRLIRPLAARGISHSLARFAEGFRERGGERRHTGR